MSALAFFQICAAMVQDFWSDLFSNYLKARQ